MLKDIKVDRQQFTDTVKRLLETPPLPKDVLSRKIARTAQQAKKKAVQRPPNASQ